MKTFNLFCALFVGSLILPVAANPTSTDTTPILRPKSIRNKFKQVRATCYGSAYWKPICLNAAPAQQAQGPLSFEKSLRTGPVARRITLSEKDIVASKNIPSGLEYGQLNLQGFPPEALAILATDSQNFTSGLSGGMDLFGIRAMWVRPVPTALPTII